MADVLCRRPISLTDVILLLILLKAIPPLNICTFQVSEFVQEKEVIKLGFAERDDEEESSEPPPDYESAIKSRAPQVGDHVISFHFRHAYFAATILSFDKDDMSYHIEWDDGDPTGRNPKYNQVGNQRVGTYF